MAALVPDGVTIGPYPLPATAIRIAAAASSGSGVFLNAIPAGLYELKPVIPPLPKTITDLAAKLKITIPEPPEPRYISPYQEVVLPITAVPTFPYEKICNITVTGPIACMLESPLPVLKFPTILRSLDQITRIGISPWWAPGLFFEPFMNRVVATSVPPVIPNPLSVAFFGGVGNLAPLDGYLTFTTTLTGYHTDRNWTDREYILKEKDVIAKYNINGKFTRELPTSNFREKFPIKTESINKYAASAITPYTFFAANPFGGGAVEEVMIPYFRCAEAILGFKNSEILAMRFYYVITIDSVIYDPTFGPAPIPSKPIRTPILAHMTVDSNNDWMGILRLLIAHTLVDGPCQKQDEEGNNLTYGDTPIPPEDPSLNVVCYRTEKEFEQANQELSDYLNNVVEELGRPLSQQPQS